MTEIFNVKDGQCPKCNSGSSFSQAKYIEVLQSMADFVIEQNSIDYKELDVTACLTSKEKTEKENRAIKIYLETLLRIDRYAHFLRQKLELWMFVPCDEDGKQMEEPKQPTKDDMWNDSALDGQVWASYQYEREQYQQAKDRVLFEGVDIDIDGNCLNIHEFGCSLEFCSNGVYFETPQETYEISKIEHLVNSWFELILTPTAQKQIYGDIK